MRVLLSTIGSRGDVQPLVALALQLRALGHDVRLCVPPDFREWIDGMGFNVTDWNYGGWKAKVEAGRLIKISYNGPSLAKPKPKWF